ncbi:hypothetical protein [Caballeronia sp. GAWG2-1]|uniref:hypothetical protein n=1 Tax=Caballeronia sp. GAWG2-1 TaxID=2921744 RepID=UPI002028E657|nr:hypothetical protein [Caballeronia sp. GAWG2-1]
MKNFFFWGVFLALLGSVIPSSAYAVAEHRVVRDYCHVSFVEPAFLDYIELPDDEYPGDIVCYLPFVFNGKLKQSRAGLPGSVQDWRALTDFVIAIERLPVAQALRKVTSSDGAAQGGIFTLAAKKKVDLKTGVLYLLSYTPTKFGTNTTSFETQALTVFVLGNERYSITFYGYSLKKDQGRDMRLRAYRDLFSSFSFLSDGQHSGYHE